MTRAEKRICHKSYNCGGFALNTFTWYRPMDMYDYLYYFDTPAENHQKIEECAEAILNQFPDIRRITDLSQVGKGEYAIAFRITSSILDDDFHFIRRGRNGIWYEKMGSNSTIKRFPKEEVFANSWHNKYYGEIALFAKKIKKLS